ncbi:MAG: methyl-accepting chemotaxis protein [Halofilum sp. (in: g-proteobacteria)]|nr:methyl-accepting chemotaxis protein [Halofilum sp. (in: g-proteobacteria)]
MKWLKLPRRRQPAGRTSGGATAASGGGSEWFASLRLGIGNPLVMLSVALFIALLGMVLSFLYAQELSRHATLYNDIVAEQRRLAEEISTTAVAAAAGEAEAYDRLQRLTEEFRATLDTLRNGSAEQGLPRLPDEFAPQLEALEGTWNVEQVNLEAISASRESVQQINEYIAEIQASSEELLVQTSRVVDQLVERNAAPDRVQAASRQLWLLQRALGALEQVQAGGGEARAAAERFARDAALYGRVLDGMLQGSERLDIEQVQAPEVRQTLRDLAVNYAPVRRHIDSITELAPELQLTSQAANELQGNLGTALARLEQAVSQRGGANTVLLVAIAFGGVVLVLLITMAWLFIRRERNRLWEQAEQNRRNQRAILRLLDELSTLADGDLSTHATVTEDITGAIADSVNSAIDALRSLVTTINATAEDVARAADRTQSTAIRLAEASNHQAREIAAANEQITEMASSMERVSENARGSAEVAMKSVTIASNGAETVRRSISGMDSIREQIQETSKRIKRLGESSQEIGDIIGVINDIAEQTNILALNAAIQASTAGEAGRGFAVVADEVQRLAERASDATKRVEALIKTIQNDTNEAVQSMEQSTAGVVSGAKLAEEAGGALGEIESVSKQIAELIQQISQEADQQASTAVEISETMNVIQGITIQTSDGTSETATSIGELTALSQELRESVTGFKLPEEIDPQRRSRSTVRGGSAGLA